MEYISKKSCSIWTVCPCLVFGIVWARVKRRVNFLDTGHFISVIGPVSNP